ncbi:MAG TPA: methyltransferase domain-containing protein [Steroidobacteraceae bacterium]|nr:methyltransferase domain-containing protein [Steroidobacteraceae bacterium]
MSTAPAVLDESFRADEPAGAPAPGTAFHLLHVRPPGYAHTEALTELAETVAFGLRHLGMRAFYREPPPPQPARTIVIGGHLLDERQLQALPRDAILYNSEQIQDGSPWLGGPYFRALMRHPVWDYSAENVRRLAAHGARSACYVPVGYVPELVRIPPLREEIDVLFYGSVNPRRQQILDALKARGLNVVALFGVYGEERDRAIGHARVVLSVHYYPAKIFETVRVSYLLANAKAVVAECGPDTFVEEDLREAVRAVPYEGLVDACVELVRDGASRTALGERARQIFARRTEEGILAGALELAAPAAAAAEAAPRPAGHALPTTLHLGSGKDYRPDSFNVDINPAWRPDAVCDLSSPSLIGSTLETGRFGAVTLAEESFEVAVANDVLEHIPDLATAMTNVLRLLKAGGVFEITVPYDLSHGAWQDPTHVRAFNERSWLYYTDWHWYLGWVEARFDVLSMQLLTSSFGVELQRAGRGNEEILRTPRAVDALIVRLRKRYLQESERREALRRQPGASAATAPVTAPPIR